MPANYRHVPKTRPGMGLFGEHEIFKTTFLLDTSDTLPQMPRRAPLTPSGLARSAMEPRRQKSAAILAYPAPRSRPQAPMNQTRKSDFEYSNRDLASPTAAPQPSPQTKCPTETARSSTIQILESSIPFPQF